MNIKFKELIEKTIKSYEGKDLASVDKRLLKGILIRKNFEVEKKKDNMMEAMKNMLLGGLSEKNHDNHNDKTEKPKAVGGGFGALFAKYKQEAEDEEKNKVTREDFNIGIKVIPLIGHKEDAIEVKEVKNTNPMGLLFKGMGGGSTP